VTAICLRALGIEQITCLDLVETKVSTASKLANLVQSDRISFQLGTATKTSFEDSSFDGVLIKDAASHFSLPSSVYAEVSRILRPGGRLVIIDDRNALNSRITLAHNSCGKHLKLAPPKNWHNLECKSRSPKCALST